MRFLAVLALLAGMCHTARAASPADEPGIKWALKTNLLHDVVITPDVGAELWFGKQRVSVAVEVGVGLVEPRRPGTDTGVCAEGGWKCAVG